MVKRLLVSSALVAAGFVGGLVLTGRMRTATESRASEIVAPMPPEQTGRAPSAPASGLTGGPDFTRIAGQAVRGVANISSLQVVRTANSPFAQDPFFRYFFGDQDVFGTRDRKSLSLGSGVIISSDGYVVTNNHVVGENMREITISLPDKRDIKGTVVGTDAATDIALLKINVSGLPTVPWGDSSRLQVGEWVLAIGSPFQLNQTVTAGIVSAKGRSNLRFAEYEDFIQTDAAINPGNSGGALINGRGELVGINTGIYSESGGYQGIGFAVPSNLARHVVDELMKYGAVQRGTVDFVIDELTPDLADEVGAQTTHGAVVTRMFRNSPSYEAGLRPGDVIVGFNGQAIDGASQLNKLIADSKINSTATFKVMRNGRVVEMRIPIVAASSSRRRSR